MTLLNHIRTILNHPKQPKPSLYLSNDYSLFFIIIFQGFVISFNISINSMIYPPLIPFPSINKILLLVKY